jgi:hypothetical protein
MYVNIPALLIPPISGESGIAAIKNTISEEHMQGGGHSVRSYTEVLAFSFLSFYLWFIVA